MKALKFSALVLAVVSSSAMANVVTDTTDSVVGGAKTLFKTAVNPGAVSLELGTLGYGANVAWGVNDSTELQAGWAGMDLNISTDIGGNDSIINWPKVLGDEYKDFEGELDLDIKTSNPYLGVQMRPMNNWLTVGAGVMVPDHEIKATATATTAGGDITVNGNNYPIAQGGTITVTAENNNKLAPYATLGFRPNVNNRFGLFAEVGAAYIGKYNTTVDVSSNITNSSDLQKDLEQEVRDSSLAWYPIAKAGMTYRF